MQHAILFDIDGTLLHAKGLGRPAFAEAFQIAYGAPIDADRISFIGATDTAIIRALAAEQGLPSTPAQEERFAIELTKRLEPRLAQGPIHVYPGVRPLLQALRDQGFRLGIVTGNLRPTAWAKLIHAGLADLFDFGAYADDAPDRDAIAAIACRRANALGATPALLIGDTPRDIQAAHANRLPCLAVTVAGWLPPQDLSAAEATLATYTLYTLASETIALYGTDHLVWTVPLVLLGLCRCLRLTYAERRAANPERLLFDPALLGLVLAWAIACALIVRL